MKVKYILIILTTLISSDIFAQFGSRQHLPDGVHEVYNPIDTLTNLYKEKRYAEAETVAKRQLAIDNDGHVFVMMGTLLMKRKQYDSSIRYFTSAIELDKNQTRISGWAHAFSGVAYLALADTDKTIYEWNFAISMDKFADFGKYARNRMGRLGGIDDLLNQVNWTVIETEDIVYYFEDTLHLNQPLSLYVQQHNTGYDSLAAFFESRLPQKLKFYVFNSYESGSAIMHHPLGFAKPELVSCFSYQEQNVGHEMTHVLSHWAYGKSRLYKSRFINEGIAVTFDLTNDDWLDKSRELITNNKINVSIDAIWQNDKAYNDHIMYPIAGAFVSYLFKTLSHDIFMGLVRDQSVTHLKSVMTPGEFKNLMDGFNTLVGLPPYTP